MRIAISGTGYVGLVTGLCLADKGFHSIVCVDVDEKRIENLKRGIPPIYEDGLEEMLARNIEKGTIEFTTDTKAAYKDAEVIFVAVGTPERTDGSANLVYLNHAIKEIAEASERDALVVIKSTVPIGTNEIMEARLNSHKKSDNWLEVASNPEFLSQGTAIKDTLEASRIVFGVESERACDLLHEVYKGFDSPIIVTGRKSAEMIKYASNDFLALKISYISDIANLCEIVGADVEDVTLGMSYDDRIGSKFLRPGIGYGGSCFPKDTKALHWLSNFNGYELKTVKAAIEVNETQKIKLVRKAANDIDNFEGLRVAILGLTFKPGTDDIREAPSVVNINYLLERNSDIIAYDPAGIENTKKIFEDRISYTDDIEEALRGAHLCFILTEWDQIKALKPEDFLRLMSEPRVYDGRNCYNPEDMKNAGISYYSIGRSYL